MISNGVFAAPGAVALARLYGAPRVNSGIPRRAFGRGTRENKHTFQKVDFSLKSVFGILAHGSVILRQTHAEFWHKKNRRFRKTRKSGGNTAAFAQSIRFLRLLEAEVTTQIHVATIIPQPFENPFGS